MLGMAITVCSDGWIFSHSDTNINLKQKSEFKFKMDDLLHFEYDSGIEKLKVTKDNSEQYEMDVEK